MAETDENLPSEELFDAEFLASLDALRIWARMVPAGGRHAEQRSKARGSGVEFTDVRPYSPGDDFRAIDWALFQRLDKFFLRLFLEDEDLPVHFLLDSSRSMAVVGEGQVGPPRMKSALQSVAALAYILLEQGDRVSVQPFADQPGPELPGTSGSRSFRRLLAWLAQLRFGGGTGLVDMLQRFAQRRGRRGLAVIVSDFLDPAGPAAVLGALGKLPHALLLVRIKQPGEEQPQLAGELRLVDCEQESEVTVTVDKSFLQRYREAYMRYDADLRSFASKRRGHYVEIRSDQAVPRQLAQLFRSGALQL
ncbi:MAG: DUF58 domain-containing protein [Planctomycetota bacterium]|nr:MAG: DUF58 domain-containing protein [Planctomycetota bacterium]